MNNTLTLTTNNNYLINEDKIVLSFTEELLEEYKNSMDLKQASKKTYIASIRIFLNWLKGNNINQVEYETILKYKDYLLANYKANTCNTHIIAIKDLFKWLETKGIKNIAKYVKKVKTENVFSREMLTLDQEKQILTNIDRTTLEGARAYALFKLMAITGLREIEVINANINDIKVNDTRPVLYIKGKGQNAKDNFVILPNGVLKAIQDYLKLRGVNSDTEPLFTSTSNRNLNGRLTTMTIQRIIKGLYKDNGIYNANITTHSLRHTCISNAIHKGANIEQVKAMARHHNINTTMIYYHNIDRLCNSPEDLLDNEFINY